MSDVTFTLLLPAGEPTIWTGNLSPEPGLDEIRRWLKPAFPDADFEHVSVWHDGKQTDLFVDEIGKLKRLERNDAATRIYRAATLELYPHLPAESLPDIVGPAVLCSRRIWF